MALLSTSLVRLGATPATKEQAISDAGGILLANGCMGPGYVASLLARERRALACESVSEVRALEGAPA